MNALVHICDYLPRMYAFEDNFTDEWIYDVIRNIAPRRLDTWFFCQFQGQFIPYEDCTVSVLTEEGLCFTFNGINSHEIYSDE